MLEARNIQKVYRQNGSELRVLKGIDLKIEKGGVHAVVGPSGAGKSTLLHILGGLDKPTQGEVLLDDRNIYKLNDGERAKIRNLKIGFIFQFYHLLPEFTALENVILPALVKADLRNSDELKGKGERLLERVGLQARMSHKPNQLSGGEQQRVAIARALVNEPAIIFCDEPTGNLDSETGEAIIDLLMELNARNQQTLLIVTHDEGIARRSHKTIHMKDGMLVPLNPAHL
ncbi:MAG: ABC transporter ATP-binding protein [Candidatus Omnitrophota bacterium]|nr:ABC transporter ATP-binding protein [Candidatus Omnitrophota bacterium]MDZ4241537.1 ABC transporter ATP-binding protein [Candidatus Omnitrophota bacterium]